MSNFATGEAPGRLDFMGGVADYSGSLVLQTPISAVTRVDVSEAAGDVATVRSEQKGTVEWPLAGLGNLQEAPAWSRYVLGCLHLFMQAHNWQPEAGLHFEVRSNVPVSMGVSSSAALEVATLRALQNLTGLKFSGTELARLAQRAENEIVGAPCGLMDQLASAHGERGALLPISCRPDILHPPVSLPAGTMVVGWPSGVKHAVSDSPYATARCAAFMGKKMLEHHLGQKLDFLTELKHADVENLDNTVLPISLSGNEFEHAFGTVDDPLSRVDSHRLYPVRAATLFPIEENARCHLVSHLLGGELPADSKPSLRMIGDLLYVSHYGYSGMGLGCDETDQMIETLQELGDDSGFYGARISGGGSGGTVIVLLQDEMLPRLEELARQMGTPSLIL